MPINHAALTPMHIGTLESRNRFVVAPMTRVSATPSGTPTDEMIDYYRDFARGGFGVVLTEGLYTDTTHSQAYLNQAGIATDEHVAAWRRVVDAVHTEGTPFIAQLMHAGALSQGNAYGAETIAPSDVAPRGEMLSEYGGSGRWPTPRSMTAADIDRVVDGFVAAATRAKQAGFDGVEVHAANGYLLDQYLTDYTNVRDDDYGGPIANRVRLTTRVISAIRRALPDGFVVGVRLSQTKVNDFTYRWPGGAADAEIVFGALTRAHYLHIASEGRDFIETARLDDGRTITEVARAVTGLPVIANGGMHDLDQAAAVLEGGHADLLSVGRGALANPDLPNRAAAGVGLERFDHAMLSPMATIANSRAWRATHALR
ncbi:NADH:flavin oxidoreductase [Mycobacterium manitobense]|uniref:NADH:flavin oxidoreductase n=1 Tax=[Mycobacterium] manitobense TaxID=190147 RepID=A0A9X2YJE5_9MYCO|nr:NADH:flavin oxidoreductase [[Mycobacterium] manitobense]MCV7169235.1 NADH:flavin oxidoreductase [[Mycobacterium] manitobense]